MIHFIHVVHVDEKQAAAICELLVLLFVGWLAWHYLPEGWAVASAWLDGMLRFPTMVQAVLLPVWALLAGLAMGGNRPAGGAALWLGTAGLYAACALLLGYPALAGATMLGSLAVLWAACMAGVSFRGWAFWLAAALAAGLSAWGAARYGLAFGPVCWLPLPASWCCLALGAAYGGVRRQAGGCFRKGGTARLLVLASALAMAAAGPFAVNAARAAGFLPGMSQSGPARPAPAVVGHAAGGLEPGGPVQPARQPGAAGPSQGGGKGGKPVDASPSTRPRT